MKDEIRTDHTALEAAEVTFGEEKWNFAQVTTAAKDATTYEHELSFLEAVKRWPKACLFSFGISLAIIMEGYDTGLGASFFALPQFRKKYGQELPNGTYQVPVAWQSGIGAINFASAVLGLLGAGILVDKIGYRYTMLAGLILLSAFIFVTFFAQNVVMLFLGFLLCGIPWGMFQSVASAYACDVAPLTLRPVLTSYINLCWVVGQFLSTGVLRSLLHRQDQWAYRIPFAIQWVWPIPIAIVTILAPESPWWLARKDRLDDARKALRRLASSSVTDAQLDNTLAMIYLTNMHEKDIEKGTSYLDLFKGTNLRRTEIAVGAWVCQVTCGNWFGGQITYFMQQAGADAKTSFDFGLGMNAISMVSTMSSWFLALRIGRRTSYLFGMTGQLITLIIIGFFGVPKHKGPGIEWATGAILILNVLIYMLTVGPVCFTIVPEVPSVRLRSKTVVVARASYNAVAVGAGFMTPAIMNPLGWNLIQKGGFVYAGTCLLSLIWVYFRLPETKGRTPIELDALFERGVRTREFRKTQIVAFEEEQDMADAIKE